MSHKLSHDSGSAGLLAVAEWQLIPFRLLATPYPTRVNVFVRVIGVPSVVVV
jgi:hypothetical protein